MDPIRWLLGVVMSSRALVTLAWKAAYVGKFDRWNAANRFPEIAGRRQLHEHVMNLFAGQQITYLEFGVHKGESLRWWVEGNAHPRSRFVGFDSFAGLPETWRKGFPKGHFSTGGVPPEIDDSRCEFKVGWFQSTLPRLLREGDITTPIVAHLDGDLYSSTLFVLFALAPSLKTGDVLILDDFTNTLHVFRALTDFTAAGLLPLQPLVTNEAMRRIAVRVAPATDAPGVLLP